MSTPTPPPATHTRSGTRPDPQRHIADLRAGLLGGRGPGASSTELEAHQHQRVAFGGLPVTAARERLALSTAQAQRTPLDDAQEHAAQHLAHPATPHTPSVDRHRWSAVVLPLAVGALLGYAAGRSRRPGPR